MMTQGFLHYGIAGRLFLMVISSLCWAGSCLQAQPAQFDFRHYTINDGLPSSEVYTVFEDKDGFLWVGTDNGVARFDGYEFTVFDVEDGLDDTVVFAILEDNGGKLWVSTYSGKIYYFENDRFYPYAYNHITTELKKNNRLVVLLDITDGGDMIVNNRSKNIIRIIPDGQVVTMIDKSIFASKIHVYQQQSATWYQGRVTAHSLISRLSEISASGEVEIQVNRTEGAKVSRRIKPSSLEKEYNFWSGNVWERPFNRVAEATVVSSSEVFIVPLDGGEVRQFPGSGKVINYIMPGKRENDYWMFLNRGQGLEKLVFSPGDKRPHVTTFLDGHSVSSGIFDHNGGFWVTTLDDGLYYCPYPEQKLYLKGDVNESVKSVSLAMTGSESFYAGYDDGSVFSYEEGDTSLRNILTPSVTVDERMFDIFYDSTNARVYTSFYFFKHPLEQRRKLDRSNTEPYPLLNKQTHIFVYFNHFPENHPGKLFATSGYLFASYSLADVEPVFDSRFMNLKFTGGHVLGIDREGRTLLGTLHGLYEITPEGGMVPNNFGVEELDERVVFIKHVNRDAMLFGTRGNGLIYLDKDTSYQIREIDGLASNMVRHIHKDAKGIFWISTLSGLSKVVFSEDNLSYTVRTFRTENGLPTNEVSQTNTWGEEVWLATSSGVVHFTEPPLDTVSTSPTIRQVRVNGKELTSSGEYALPAGRQDISIRFGTINYFLGDRVPYRYRITDDVPWQESFDRTANYPNLGAGTYRFAVQSRNQDGYWSESTEVDIFIATPWYATWWAITIAIIALLGALSTYFLIRERRRKREQDLLLQINELEHAALHAQMNPHFVFNALNSIQNFVLQNDAKQAATYLSRFARIIRQTLRSSVDGKHTLGDELDMLSTYLVLEKLRFKEGFNYELTVSTDLSLEDISLPPLLIQPFVENAIVHGLKGRERGGWISIDFTGSSEVLNVRIEDNGKGFNPSQEVENDSLGMDITRRRLDMMNRNFVDRSGMNIEPLIDDDGQACGTRVTLNIQLQSTTETSIKT